MAKRRQFTPEFKARVVLDILTGVCQWTRIVTRLVNPNCYEA